MSYSSRRFHAPKEECTCQPSNPTCFWLRLSLQPSLFSRSSSVGTAETHVCAERKPTAKHAQGWKPIAPNDSGLPKGCPLVRHSHSACSKAAIREYRLLPLLQRPSASARLQSHRRPASAPRRVSAVVEAEVDAPGPPPAAPTAATTPPAVRPAAAQAAVVAAAVVVVAAETNRSRAFTPHAN